MTTEIFYITGCMVKRWLSDSSLLISPDSVQGTRYIFGQHIVYSEWDPNDLLRYLTAS